MVVLHIKSDIHALFNDSYHGLALFEEVERSTPESHALLFLKYSYLLILGNNTVNREALFHFQCY